MQPLEFFQPNFAAARQLFADVAGQQGLALESHLHPLKGPNGEALYVDAVRVGPADASRLLVSISGVHGVETLAGAACQSGWLASGQHRELPADTAVLLIHGINCWGAAHLRRNNEDNVDLCRNFIDFAQPLPVNEAYERIHPAVACPERQGPVRDAARQALDRFVAECGMDQYVHALMGGQYQHADGFSYGGVGPAWSRQLLLEILSRHRQGANRAIVVEYHTGLGPWAYGSAVTMHRGSELARTREIFGRWVLAPNEASHTGGHRVTGHTTEGYAEAFGGAELTCIVLEYGTVPPQESLPAMLDDHWLTLHGDPGSGQGGQIRQRLLDLHYPQDSEWRLAVWTRSEQVLRQAFRGLGGA